MTEWRQNVHYLKRLNKEIEQLLKDPPPGVCVYPKDDMVNHLEAKVEGVSGTPYENGIFTLDIVVPNRYPFQPPSIRFITKVYHPNIDTAGRICLDILKDQWKPSLNIMTVLTSLRLLLSEPNCDDALMPEIAHEYLHVRRTFEEKARNFVKKYASQSIDVGDNTERPTKRQKTSS